jgi:bifunctional isochorismate lyase/aryl carrier protein
MNQMKMKEAYFTQESIRGKSLEMLESVRGMRHRQPLAAEQCALLVLDMQNCFFNETSHAFIPSAAAIVDGVNRLCKAFRARGLPVIMTRHINSPEDAGRMSIWWRGVIAEADPFSRLIDELDVGGAVVMKKSQYDAFHETPLADLLREKGVRQIVISGVMTHLCCETTARSGFVRGFDVFFTVDGTATYNEAFHSATLLNLSHGFAVPILIEEILSEL